MGGGQPPSRREGFLEALLGAIADAPVCVYDRELRMVEYFWSGEERRYGYSPSEILGKRFSELVSAEDSAPVERAIREIFATGEPRRFEQVFSLPVGDVAFEVRLAPVRASNGTVEYVLSTSYDVTERRRTEAALRESRHRFEMLAESAPVGIVHLDRRGQMVFVNRVVEQITGLSAAEFRARGWLGSVHPEDRQRMREAEQRQLESPAVREDEARIVRPDGSISWVLARTVPDFDETGRCVGHLASMLDISERKSAEDALRESEHRFHSLAEAMPVGVWRTDLEPRLVYANRRTWELLDIDPDDGENRDLHTLLARMAARHSLASSESLRLWAESENAVREEAVNASHFTVRRADGTECHLQTLAVPEFDSAGSFVGHVGVTMDVSDVKGAQQELARHRDHLGELVAERTALLERSYEALRRSERLAAVGTFAAGIAHQINNPVGAILLAAQFALEDAGNRERVETSLRDITADARHCGQIVRGVLEFAQGPTADPLPCDLNQIAVDCVRKLTVGAAERGATLQLDLDAELPPVAGSEAALEQVLANLVYNSIEAGASQIAVGTRQAGGAVELVVRDDGSGIADENLDRIFDPLFTTRATRGGTGLGLALARGVVEAHGGAIEVSSRESEGTAVLVRLPRA